MNTCETCLALARALADWDGRGEGIGAVLRRFLAEHTPRESEASGPPTSANTDLLRPSAGATAGPFHYEWLGPGKVWIVEGPPQGVVAAEPERGAAVRLTELLNAAYRAGRDSMREPTAAMLQAGAAALRNPPPVHHPDDHC